MEENTILLGSLLCANDSEKIKNLIGKTRNKNLLIGIWLTVSFFVPGFGCFCDAVWLFNDIKY